MTVAAPAHCRRNGCTADPGTDCASCPIAVAAKPLLRASHKRRPPSPSDRPPVGAEPGSLFETRDGEE